MAPTGWWRKPPFLPVPDQDWLEFRMATAYGHPSGANGQTGDAGRSDRSQSDRFSVDDLMTWLEWRRAWPNR